MILGERRVWRAKPSIRAARSVLLCALWCCVNCTQWHSWSYGFSLAHDARRQQLPRRVCKRLPEEIRHATTRQASMYGTFTVPKQKAAQMGSWLLPSVEKDTSLFSSGKAEQYAWLQSGNTVYVFVPVVDEDESTKDVTLNLTNEGTEVLLVVEGVEVLNGQLAHPCKPGEEIWMVEDAADGQNFIVVELEKSARGRDWRSIMKPEVTFTKDLSSIQVVRKMLPPEQRDATVKATLLYLQKQQGKYEAADDDRLAAPGDAVTVDIKGFEMNDDGSRGAALDVGPAQNMRIELDENFKGVKPEVLRACLGISKGQTKDVTVQLGAKGGSLSGQKILLAVTCTGIEELSVPELNDDFAQKTKQLEIFKQAGTEAGVREDDAATEVETFTMAALESEIALEVQESFDQQADAAVEEQLKAALLDAADIRCDWAAFEKSEELYAEELGSVVSAVRDVQALPALDIERVKKESWDELSKPSMEEMIQEVGNDPERDYEAAFRIVSRRYELDQVMRWLLSTVQVQTEYA